MNTSGDIDVSEGLSIQVHGERTGSTLWARAWFLVSCVPRYLFTGSVRLP